MATTASTPSRVSELDNIVSFMSSDKSNDWSAEIDALRAIETELLSLQGEIETYRANVGPIESIVKTSRYARLGQFAAVTLGANEEHQSCDITSDMTTFWQAIGSPAIGGQSDEDLIYWRAIADLMGIRHDGPKTEELAAELSEVAA